MRVPILDLHTQYEPIKEDILKALERVFDSKMFMLGPETEAMEAAMVDYIGAPYALGVSSGTDAILLALMALGIGEGDEVITVPFTFFATAGCIARAGAKAVFVDIEEDTFLMDVSQIESKITPKTKAIMPVHLYGQVCDMDAIMEIAKKHNLAVIEDAAQAIGSTYTTKEGVEKQAGTFGDVGCFSFFPTKNLGACGDAGLVTAQDPELFELLKMMRVHGGKQRYYHDVVGGNFRIDAFQSAVLGVKLPYLDEHHLGRQKNAAYYNQQLADIVITPTVRPGRRMIYNQYTIRVEQRDALQKFLADREIASGIYYPVSLHLQECFKYLGYKEGDFPVSEKVTREVLSLPVYKELSQEQIDFVCDSIKEFYS